MKVTLISPYYSVTAYGLRVISSVLRDRGHETQMIFLPYQHPHTAEDFLSPYPEPVLRDVGRLCRDSGLVGITLMSNYVGRAADLTRSVRAASKAKVVWGGIHGTVAPDACLEHADYVCPGEGEDAMAELATRLDSGEATPRVDGLWSSGQNKNERSPVRPLIQDLDGLPFPDYQIENHWVLFEGEVRAFDRELMRYYHSEQMRIPEGTEHLTGIQGRRPALYQTMASRGCPYSCTYCCNDALKRQSPGQRVLRFRSPRNIVDELCTIRKRFPFFDMVLFSDDSLLTMQQEAFSELAGLYRQEVRLPFICLATPTHTTENKVAAFVEAGMVKIKIGIQSGSSRILELYDRRVTSEQVLAAAGVVHRYRDRLAVDYDIIVDCPWETTRDKLDTLDLAIRLPRPCALVIYALTLYPGTQLYDRALGEGVGRGNMYDGASFYVRRATYTNLLLQLLRRNWPKALVRLLRNPLFVLLFENHLFEASLAALLSVRRRLKGLVRKLSGAVEVQETRRQGGKAQ